MLSYGIPFVSQLPTKNTLENVSQLLHCMFYFVNSNNEINEDVEYHVVLRYTIMNIIIIQNTKNEKKINNIVIKILFFDCFLPVVLYKNNKQQGFFILTTQNSNFDDYTLHDEIIFIII